jgi:1-acyl-sn-glycerol-3-phosphate acyltransferase
MHLFSYLFTAPAIILATIVMGTLSLAVSLFGSKENLQHEFARIWSRIILRSGFVQVKCEGVEKLDPQKSYVLVCNHASYMDTPVILASIPLQFRFFAKQGLFHVPLMGTHLKRAGHFAVVFDNPRASLRSMAAGARAIMEKKVSVLLFPEGGRSENGLTDFKEGAAYIAIKAGVPIVPMGLIGTREVLPMHTLGVRPGTVTLRVGDPIETAHLSLRDRTPLTAELYRRIAELSLGA